MQFNAHDAQILHSLGCRPWRLLGEGASGRVYLADDAAGRRVAIKLLVSEDEEQRERFRREARLSLRLRHPHLVAGIAHRSLAGHEVLVLEWVPGCSLQDLLDREQVLDEGQALQGLIQAARALAHLHCSGVVHRDVKPANLLLRSLPRGELQLWVCDLGLAKDVDSASFLTETGTALGTLLYMAPEVLRTAVVGWEGDVYGLGAAIYHALVGRPPFDHPNAAGLVKAIVYEEPVDPRRLRPELSPVVVALLRRLLAKDPAARPRPEELVQRGEELLAARRRAGGDPPR